MKRLFLLLAAITLSVLVPVSVASATESHASGGGWYFVEPGVKSQFQFNQSFVQCKIAHAVLDDGTVFQMFMFSTSIDSFVISGNTVTITGFMDSSVKLHHPDGSQTTLSENVPFTAVGVDNGKPGAGLDTFSLSITYTATPDFDQADLFGTSATFAGPLEAGNVVVE